MIELRYLISSSDANNQYIHTQPYKRLQYRYYKLTQMSSSAWALPEPGQWSMWFDIPMIVQGEVYSNGSGAVCDATPENTPQEYVETVSNVQGVVY